MNKDSKKNDIEKYKQSKPAQLELFELLGQGLEKYSNTVELYDVMPKFYFGGVQREKGKFTDSLPILKRNFKHRGKDYDIKVMPAALEGKGGKTIHYYPSQREELVEDVIRKLATRKKAVYLDEKEVAVKFTLYEVQKELENMGHGYNITEIKEAIQVCSKSTVEIKSLEGNEVSISSNIFPSVFMETKEMEGGKNRVVVILHPLVTKSINEGSYRLTNYEKLMKLKMPLSRWIHRRISHLFSQATVNNPYTIKISTIIRDSGMKEYKTMSERIRQVVKSMNELKAVGTIASFEQKKIMEKNKILDVLFSLYASEEFVADIKKANKLANLRNAKKEISQEVFDIGSLKARLEDEIFGLTTTVINNIAQKIKSRIEYDDVMLSLDAAEQWILKLKKEKKEVNPAGIARLAIKDNWIPAQEKEVKKEEIQDEEKFMERVKNAQKKEENRRKNVGAFQDKWEIIRDSIKSNLGDDEFDKWFKSVSLHNFLEDGNIVVISVPTRFERDWIKREFLDKISKVIEYNISIISDEDDTLLK